MRLLAITQMGVVVSALSKQNDRRSVYDKRRGSDELSWLSFVSSRFLLRGSNNHAPVRTPARGDCDSDTAAYNALAVRVNALGAKRDELACDDPDFSQREIVPLELQIFPCRKSGGGLSARDNRIDGSGARRWFENVARVLRQLSPLHRSKEDGFCSGAAKSRTGAQRSSPMTPVLLRAVHRVVTSPGQEVQRRHLHIARMQVHSCIRHA